MSIVIGRPIEGISLNGNEWLLNEDGTMMEFNSTENAKKFLENEGVEKNEYRNK